MPNKFQFLGEENINVSEEGEILVMAHILREKAI